jgi:hypothetical protein
LASQGTKIKITFLLRFVIFLQALKAKRASLRRIDVSPPSGGACNYRNEFPYIGEGVVCVFAVYHTVGM